ncbi:MAG: exodeoxyribonuclease VII large subunit [Deltaproteobacteria bacterium]|nr:exodeoxyribonuclease VII large subunit [Deltaproteobacteria bacterium]
MAGQLEFELKSAAHRIALSVSQLVRMVRETLEVNLGQCWVVGEVSNMRLAPSNHLYFTLKDTRSSINVVMFNSVVRRMRFRVGDGMQVVVSGRVNLYEVRGTLQFYAEEIEPRGLGALQLAYEQLKQRLGNEGLFDASRKQHLPMLSRRIGIVTALGGAALRDILRVLLDRYPNLHVIIRPALVQGPSAAPEIANALDDLNTDARADLIIAGRGGGSLEDLWAFNEELVARAIFRSAIPVISAVGHEIDYSIADFAADVRAPTPTAAAQLVVPIKAELRRRLFDLQSTLAGAVQNQTSSRRRHVTYLEPRLRDPRGVLRQLRQRLDAVAEELNTAIISRVRENRRNLVADSRRLDAVSPLRVLERGYAVVLNAGDGLAVTDATRVEVGDELDIRLHRGRLRARITERRP